MNISKNLHYPHLIQLLQKFFLIILLITSIIPAQAVATTDLTTEEAAAVTACINGSFSTQGDNYWKTVSLKLTNQCGKAIDFQNAVVTFKSISKIDTAFWGSFSQLPWPDSTLKIVSQAAEGGYLNSISLHFLGDYNSTLLPTGSSITIQYGIAKDDHVDNSVQVFTGTPISNPVSLTLSVSGAPASSTSTTVTLTPTDGSTRITKNIPLQNGAGTATQLLVQGRTYTVSVPTISGYTVSYTPQPLTASAGLTENIRFTAAGGGTGGQTPVAVNGRLKVCGTTLCNQNNTPVQLRGMSTHGLQWFNQCLTSSALDTLANNFKSGIVRVAMYIQEGGYETDPAGFTTRVNQLIDEISKRGMYVLVDWHMLSPGDPNYNLERAKTFFTAIAKANSSRNNMIYEIANEPNGVSWSTVKKYAEALIPVIRAVDPNTVIIIGTPGWSSLGLSDGQSIDTILNSPLNFPNIMYTFHFYAASHGDNYLNALDRASNTLPIFVTEWGTQTYSGDGNNNFTMSGKYTALMARKKISWTNWNFSDDFRSGAIWKTGTCTANNWSTSNLKESGTWVRNKIISP